MKKLTLAIACSSLALSPTVFAEADADAYAAASAKEVIEAPSGSSYVTGNVQYHSTYLHGSKVTSTLEAGHTFSTGTTLLVEFDGIQVGNLKTDDNAPAFVTLGVEQSFNINDNFWVAAGYHHLMASGDNVQYRPLIKVGYNFDNGISISNRSRWHIDATDAEGAKNDVRMDNAIAYALQDQPITLKYNNVYIVDAGAMDHELRVTWTRKGVQPYIEYRSQANNVDGIDANNALVIGAAYGF